MKRRKFLHNCTTVATSLLGASYLSFSPKQKSSTQARFYSLEKIDGRWWLIDPKGRPFFSIGLNHIDPASLRYPENKHIWEQKYENSMEKWLNKAVRPDLQSWGFNTVGWNREMVTRGLTNHRHSRAFTYEEYQWLDMPYCHQLPFGEFHQWEAETRNPDFFSSDFVEWCDYVAREHCVPLANDTKLIGYFYIDCPTWVHTRAENHWKGPLFDPKKLESETGQQELFAMATQYYKVTQEAIKRYDPNHLILGDRYEANEPLPEIILQAAKPFVNVLSFQDLQDVAQTLDYWYKKMDMPVLWADGSHVIKIPGTNIKRQDGNWYKELMPKLMENPGCVGSHLCGAYIRNRKRNKGLMDENEVVDTEMVELIKEANMKVQQWVLAHKGG